MMGTSLKRLLAVFRRARADRELDEEIRAHIDLLAAEYERQGMSPADSRLAARRAFGAIEPMKARYRDRRGLPWLDDLRHDLRYALRGLGRARGFSAVAVLTLALGIGANTAIFTLLDAVLLRPLPVRQPEELVLPSYQIEGRRSMPFAAYQFRALAANREAVAGLAAFRPLPVSITHRGETVLASGQLVSANYHELLGVRAELGRTLTAADDAAPGGGSVAVISYGYWQRVFGGARDAIGARVEVNGRPFTVVGVTSRGFLGTEPGRAVDVTIPLSMQPGVFGARLLIDDASEARWLYLIGRLAPGVTRDGANARLTLTWDQLRASRVTRRPQAAWPFALLDGARGMHGLRDQFSRSLLAVMAMVGVVLLVACANLATLLLARSSARRHEIALRLALGASRSRLVRQLLTESLLLSILGGTVGIGLAYVASDLLVQIMSRGTPQPIALDLAPNLRTLAFTLAASLAAGLAFSIVPSLRAARFGIATAARATAGVASAGGRWSQVTIAVQVALSIVLLVEAGLFARSLSALRDIDTGFVDGDRVLIAVVRTREVIADQVVRQIRFFRDLSARASALDARSVTVSMDVPLAGGLSMARNIDVIGRQREPSDDVVWFNYVGPRFFETMGIAVDGRDIRVDDEERAPAVAVISRSLARRYFPGVSAVGRRIRFDSASGPTPGVPVDVEVVGVAADVAYTGLRTSPTEMIYLPFFQGRGAEGVGLVTIALRAARSAEDTAAALRRDLRANAPDLLIADLATLNERRDAMLARERVVAALSMWFAGLAPLPGCVGLYGTVSYAVTRRTSELGLRVALGAEWPRLVRAVLGESLRPVLVGVTTGLPLAFAAGRVSESLLFGIRGSEPSTYLVAIAALLLSGAAAAAIPARRATRIDPIVALRVE
jgi:predicted permease